jgi:hypothetical protein
VRWLKKFSVGCIVPTVAPPGHRRGNVILSGKDVICLCSILCPLVTVEDQSISDLFVLFGLLEGLGHQGNGVAAVQNMANDEAIVEILDDGQKRPALLQAAISDVIGY